MLEGFPGLALETHHLETHQKKFVLAERLLKDMKHTYMKNLEMERTFKNVLFFFISPQIKQ